MISQDTKHATYVAQIEEMVSSIVAYLHKIWVIYIVKVPKIYAFNLIRTFLLNYP